MGNYSPYLDISFGEIEVVKDPDILSCPGTDKDSLKVFKIKSRLNFPVYNFIQLINKILKKFYEKKIKNFKAFIISLDNLLDFYLNEEEIKEANNILEYKLFSRRECLVNLKNKIKIFQKLFNNLEKINNKEKKNFIKSVKTILEDDEVLNNNEINTFIELLTQIFDKNIFEEENILDENNSNILGGSNSNVLEDENLITQDLNDARIEEISNLSYKSNFSSYSKNSQHQIRKMEKEIERLKKLIKSNKND